MRVTVMNLMPGFEGKAGEMTLQEDTIGHVHVEGTGVGFRLILTSGLVDDLLTVQVGPDAVFDEIEKAQATLRKYAAQGAQVG